MRPPPNSFSAGTIDYAMKRVTLTGLLLIAAFVVAQLLCRLVATKIIKTVPLLEGGGATT